MKPKLFGTILFTLTFLASITSGVASRQYTVFDYQCPDSCLCAPDIQDRDMLVIGCNWPYVQPEMFTSFTRNLTKSLTIHCTGGDKVKNSLGSGTFKGFVELRELKISNCSLDALPADTFTGLDKLLTLSISGFGSPAIDEKLFNTVPQIERIWLTKSELKRLPSSVLCPLSGLQILTLSNNQLGDIRLGLDGDECKLEHLILLDVSGNKIRHVGAGDLKSFPNIRRLSAGANQLDDLEMDSFQSTPLLQYLDLESNLLRTLPSLPDSLLNLNAADNRLETLPATVANLEQLAHLNVSRNEIDASSPFTLYSNKLETLDFSRNSFDSIPLKLFSRSVEVLKKFWISGNKLEELEAGLFANFTSLQTLDISDNHLKSLSSGIFDGLSELTELNLSNNSIYHVDVEAFRPLGRQLRQLDMSGNQLAELPIAIGRLARANTLDFSKNLISKAYKFNLNKITHLARLDLSENLLEMIESYVFADCPHLTELNLRSNRIKEMNGDAFQKCPQLRTLDLSKNELESLDGALREIRSLRHLNMSSNKLTMLNWSELPHDLISVSAAHNQINLLSAVEQSRLRRLELQHNQISLLLAEQLPDVLEHLNISNNQLQQLGDATFAHLKQLKSVDMRDNNLSVVQAQNFAPASTVVRLFLSSNPLNCSCQTEWLRNATSTNAAPVQLADHSLVTCNSAIRQTGIADINLHLPDTTPEDFVCEYNEEMCEPQCVCCQYTSCDCKSRCPRGCRCFHDGQFKLNIVKCEANPSKTTDDLFDVRSLPMHATHIRLRGVSLPQLKKHDFSARGRLVELELNATGLKQIEATALNNLASLKTLSIVNNKLDRLSGNEFVKSQQVRKLRLSNNRLNQLGAQTLSEMFPQLEELHLDGNSFVDLPEAVEAWPREGQLSKVYLGTNPFRCDCQTQPDRYRAQEWIRQNPKAVVDLKQVLCVENVTKALKTNDTAVFSDQPPNEGDLFVMPMVEFLKVANRTFCTQREMGLFSSNPIWNNFLIVALCLFMALLLVVLILTGISVVRRGRHTLKNPRYRKATNSSSLLNGIHSASQGSSPHPLLHYDIFMSYSQEDSADVQQELCMPLQEQYSLAMLHRGDLSHYQSNAYTDNGLQCVSDELIQKINSCRTLLWYLTQNFIRKEWTSVAVKTAHRCFAQDRQRLVIVLLGPDVNTDELDPELGQMLRRNARVISIKNSIWWTLLMSYLPRPNQSGDGTFGLEDLPDNQSETTQIYSDVYGNIVTNDRAIVPSDVV
ncbi:Protein toll [Aphelenchoides bicaudatus]|nr:Protein toll [Aphelenchoides bicaudatus]